MTPIERAARALMSDWGAIDAPTERELQYALEKACSILTAAYPGLMSDPPTHWVAPMKTTEMMGRAAIFEVIGTNTAHFNRQYIAARDQYLKDTPAP